MVTVKIKRDKEAMLPRYAHLGDAGMDLFSAEECVLKPGQRKLVSTGIRMELPHGYEAQTRPRSGLAINHGITVLNTPGTIDSGYRGEVKVVLVNLGDEDYHVEKGGKIAQIVISKIEEVEVIEVNSLSETARNDAGFGSTK